jgi:hypothetical protein
MPVDFGFMVRVKLIFHTKVHAWKSTGAALYLPNQWRIKFCTFSSRTSHFTHLSETYRYLGAGTIAARARSATLIIFTAACCVPDTLTRAPTTPHIHIEERAVRDKKFSIFHLPLSPLCSWV